MTTPTTTFPVDAARRNGPTTAKTKTRRRPARKADPLPRTPREAYGRRLARAVLNGRDYRDKFFDRANTARTIAGLTRSPDTSVVWEARGDVVQGRCSSLEFRLARFVLETAGWECRAGDERRCVELESAAVVIGGDLWVVHVTGLDRTDHALLVRIPAASVISL